MIAVVLSSISAADAGAYNLYLRPVADYPGDRWTITGASNAWEALDDPVTELQTPNNADFISNSTSQSGNWGVDIGTIPLVGDTINSSTAYFYLSTAAAVRVDVRVKQNPLGGDTLHASSTQSGIGWHSVPVDLKGSQALLDEIYFRFLSGTTTSTRTVSAAFLKLDLKPSSPRVYWGAWMDGDVALMPREGEKAPRGDAPWDSETWSLFEQHTGEKGVSVVHFGQNPPWILFPETGKYFEKGPLDLAWGEERNALGLMDMRSDAASFGTHVSLAQLAAGAKDKELESWAKEVKAYGKPFFLRWNWEMNLAGGDFVWAQEAASNPKSYVDAWRHFHDIVVAAGATNVTWVWCPNVKYPGSTPLSSLWPGTQYVDWTCMDGYNWGTNSPQPETWRSFQSVFGPTYEELLALAPEKPIMIGETATTAIGGDKAAWVANALTREVPLSFPKVKAFLWFNWNAPKGAGRMDWPIESSGSAETAFSNGIAHSYYSSPLTSELPPLTKIQPLP
ncbi:MAG TPA: hypothetical protein VFU11_00290 [Solirubrobacterales bacterium]|nr:hypothetical protein [Solirubrobacterales bacterium]